VKRFVASVCAVALLAALSASAWAAPERLKRKDFVFKEFEEIMGTLITPEGVRIHGTVKRPFPTLIEYRKSFKPEMLQLTEQL
jgi:hypothetical protein